jgi:hypothetical protein
LRGAAKNLRRKAGAAAFEGHEGQAGTQAPERLERKI